MKKVKIFFIAIFALSITACLKDKPNVDFSNVGAIAEISSSNVNPTLNAPSSGLDYFGAATLPVFSVDTSCNCYLPYTVTFDVNITGEYPPKKDVPVKVSVDDAKRVAYNAGGNVQFVAAPDSIFKFDTTVAVIKAGSRLATFKVTFYPDKIDPTQSYMLPITLTDASGITISGNLSTIYLHIIGNVIAGPYTQEWIRYNRATMTGTPAYDQISSTLFTPVSPSEISVSSGTGVTYLLSFTNTGGVLSDFKLSFDAASVTGITISSGPTIVTADPVAGKYEFNFTYLNASGAARNITDKFTR